jgi:hypothetical protein
VLLFPRTARHTGGTPHATLLLLLLLLLLCLLLRLRQLAPPVSQDKPQVLQSRQLPQNPVARQLQLQNPAVADGCIHQGLHLCPGHAVVVQQQGRQAGTTASSACATARCLNLLP